MTWQQQPITPISATTAMRALSEWLQTNGLGGFASGTVSGVRTRRYHALLLSARGVIRARDRDRRMMILRRNWREYGIEAMGAGLILLTACLIATLLAHPASPTAPPDAPAWVRRALMGIGMGATLYGLVHSPWGRRSGAHFNPAVTLTFFRLGRVAPVDMIGYVAAQFAGSVAGIFCAVAALRFLIGAERVNYVVTAPGGAGVAAAFAAEFVISFLLMTAILTALSSRRLAAHTGVLVAALVAVFITLESPLSGTSMNPARTFAADLAAAQWTALWIYFVAPTTAMLIAAERHRRRIDVNDDSCAKLIHDDTLSCIFCTYRKGP